MRTFLQGALTLWISTWIWAYPVQAQTQAPRFPELAPLQQPYHPDMEDLLQQAQDGSAEANFLLGRIHHYGLHIPVNRDIAVKYFQRAADQDYPEAFMYLSVDALENDNTKAHMDYIQQAAELYGIPEDEFQENSVLALAKAGSSYARMYAATTLEDQDRNPGEITQGDEVSSVFLAEAANQGEPMAMHHLAIRLLQGLGMKKAPTWGYDWLLKSAENGLLRSQTHLGIGLRYGDFGLHKDYQEADRWLGISASRGDITAQEIYANFLLDGLAGEERIPESLQWFHKAANQGSITGQGMVGALHLDGKIVPRDLVIAYSWLNLAARDNENAAVLLEKIEPQMSANEITKAQARSRELSTHIQAAQGN